MGWGTTFDVTMYISREKYQSIYDVECEIDSIKEDIQNTKEKLLMYAISGTNAVPEKGGDGDYIDNKIDYIHYEITQLLEYYDELNARLFKLELLNKKDVFEKRIEG